MTTQPDASQVKIRLEILPEERNFDDIELANKIGREAAIYFKTRGYNVEPVYLGELGGGGGNILLVWISQFIEIGGTAFIAAAVNEIVNEIVDILKKTFSKRKIGENKGPHASVTITLSEGDERNVPSFPDHKVQVSIAFQYHGKQAVNAKPGSEVAEPTITIKVSA